MKFLIFFIICLSLELNNFENFNDLNSLSQFQSDEIQQLLKSTQNQQIDQQETISMFPDAKYLTKGQNLQQFGWNQQKIQKVKPIGGIQFWANIPNLYKDVNI